MNLQSGFYWVKRKSIDNPTGGPLTIGAFINEEDVSEDGTIEDGYWLIIDSDCPYDAEDMIVLSDRLEGPIEYT